LCEVAASDRRRRVGPMPGPAGSGRTPPAGPGAPTGGGRGRWQASWSESEGPCCASFEPGLSLLERSSMWGRGTVARDGNGIRALNSHSLLCFLMQIIFETFADEWKEYMWARTTLLSVGDGARWSRCIIFVWNGWCKKSQKGASLRGKSA